MVVEVIVGVTLVVVGAKMIESAFGKDKDKGKGKDKD